MTIDKLTVRAEAKLGEAIDALRALREECHRRVVVSNDPSAITICRLARRAATMAEADARKALEHLL